ncbi:hypothetical protein CCMSSC00406_0002375 [Pleurotus cornucopiae]|uniref:Uncharacterized protein n=1 Tax=Pleurotus cornucopiae TaxID=5321 RepID=A0ACB7ITH3_PLECO|nr:hypothetical protein CCMSSC00406_0002375 [Pleurotus cornucopiae]
MPVDNIQLEDAAYIEAMATAGLSPHASSLLLVDQAREMSNSPSPLAMMLSDPDVLETITSKTPRKKPRDRSRSPAPRRDHKTINSLLYTLVGEEERQALHLKSALNAVNDRLQNEISRANLASERTSYAESRAMEFCSRAAVAENSLAVAERELATLRAELESCRSQLQANHDELRHAKTQVAGLERERSDAEASAQHAKDVAREYARMIQEYEEKDISVEEEHRAALQRWFDEGQEQGWQEGHKVGYKKGRRKGFSAGRTEGLREGRETGKKEERKSALLAFDDFLVAQTYGPDDKLAEMVHRWRSSVYPSAQFDARAPTPVSQPSHWGEGSETDSSDSY